MTIKAKNKRTFILIRLPKTCPVSIPVAIPKNQKMINAIAIESIFYYIKIKSSAHNLDITQKSFVSTVSAW